LIDPALEEAANRLVRESRDAVKEVKSSARAVHKAADGLNLQGVAVRVGVVVLLSGIVVGAALSEKK